MAKRGICIDLGFFFFNTATFSFGIERTREARIGDAYAIGKILDR
jgi:hypothetical protein